MLRRRMIHTYSVTWSHKGSSETMILPIIMTICDEYHDNYTQLKKADQE